GTGASRLDNVTQPITIQITSVPRHRPPLVARSSPPPPGSNRPASTGRAARARASPEPGSASVASRVLAPAQVALAHGSAARCSTPPIPHPHYPIPELSTRRHRPIPWPHHIAVVPG